MSNSRMNPKQLAVARTVLAEVHQRIAEVTGGEQRFSFALGRYVYKNLSYDERGTPAERTELKLEKLTEQHGVCAYNKCLTPHIRMTKEDEPELDRLDAMKGYTRKTTVLMHHACHRDSQKAKGFG